MVYDLIPTMPERWLQPLMLAFTQLLESNSSRCSLEPWGWCSGAVYL
jgi:hypothetical protein